jgi:folate-dependent phosphoribosylglycinamide formyltransferase PurN
MSGKPRAVLLTGDEQRHRFAATKLASRLDLVGIVSEAKAPAVASVETLADEDLAVIKSHFAERDEAERRYFGDAHQFPGVDLLSIRRGATNSAEVFEWVREREPDVALLYGSGIIKPPLLDFYDGRIVNLHLGLSPYYRGSGTNFWPLVHRRPECAGATIHLATRSVDAGDILTQVRPDPESNDRAHDLGTKTLIAALEAMPRAVELYLSGLLAPQPQNLAEGREFRQRDFNAEAVRAMRRNFDTGMMREYIEDGERRRAQYPIITIE